MKRKFCYYGTSLFIFLISCQSNTDNIAELERKKMEHEILEQRRELDSMKNIKSDDKNSLADKYNDVHKSVVLIVAEGDYSRSIGSAIIINSNGDAISNFHVFENSSSGYARDADGNKYPITKLYSGSEDGDYIFFKIGDGTHIFQPARIANEMPPIGSECFAVGNPSGLEQTLSNGIISGYREANGESYIQHTANIYHGSSGGALFNSKGEVIGINTLGFEGNLFFAIGIENLPLNNYKNNVSVSQKTYSKIDDDEAIETIKEYLSTENNRDFSGILSFYSNNMQRYWDLQNPSVKQLSNRYQHAWSIMGSSISDLKDVEKVGANTYIYTTDFIYYSIKDQVYKTVKNSRIKVVFDDNYKIISIYGV